MPTMRTARLADRSLAGLEIQLRQDTNQLELNGPSGTTVELTDEEADLAGRTSHLAYELEKRGFSLDPSLDHAELPEVAQLRAQLPSDGLSVLLDTTTVLNALSAIHGEGMLSPSALLDLSVLTAGIVLFDDVVLQPHSALRDQLGELSDFVTVLQWDEDFRRGPLYHQYRALVKRERLNSRFSQYASMWSEFLGEQAGSVAFDTQWVEQLPDSPDAWDRRLVDVYAAELFDPPDDRPSRDEFLAIQTVRTLFNDDLAGALRVPYLASSIRAPVHADLVRSKAQVVEVMDELLGKVGMPTAVGEHRATRCTAPFLLGLALETMDRPGDYFKATGDLKRRFSDLRELLYRDRDELERRPGLYASSFVKYLEKCAKRNPGQNTVGAIAMDAPAAAADPAALVTLALKVLHALNAGPALHQQFARFFRPAVYLLFDLRDEVSRLSLLNNRIETLWRQRWSAREYSQLQSWAKVQPLTSLRPGDEWRQ